MRVHGDLLAVKYDIERGEYSLRRFFTDVALNMHRTRLKERRKDCRWRWISKG